MLALLTLCFSKGHYEFLLNSLGFQYHGNSDPLSHSGRLLF